MARWSIGRVRSVPPAPGSDCEAAFALHFQEDDQPDPQITVEYASGGGGRYASPAHARATAAPYLDDEIPPRRLIVNREGNTHRRES
jgi:hypothetical protein